MNDEYDTEGPTLLGLTASIVAAYVEAKRLPAEQLPQLIAQTHRALSGLAAPESVPDEPKVPGKAEIRRSIRNDGLVSFEDGRVYKTLKRHLATQGLTPAEYRAKWGLPADYPMVAPEYAARRSELAKAAGLGRKPATRKKSRR